MLQGVTGTHLLWNCVILMMFHSIGSSFASPTQHVLEKSEVAPSKFKVKLKDASEALVNFFAPMTCRHKDKQALIPCRVGENINTTECLENKCCPSKTSHELKCYTPFKDNLQLTFRLFVLGAGGFFILGCLPFCCCACLRRSQCFNPLRSASKEVEQIVQKKRAHSENNHGFLSDLLKKNSKGHKSKKKEEHSADLEDLKQDKDTRLT
ncbi:fragile X mental retardation 1 neighbor protein isoform X3 [Apteryx rowi]|uniref:fragile X mental retardation 1 neighbor protein isoform X3 n=1 Tax=Apteryx rowi TaxID=308060 RepID=UPI0006B10275|nr:PREDICTED: fragile X mental retardation 1 neighbor protein [Apteryx mantelli mantelli]XP_025935942.1 fragile X mental retardation 1 neighbor protein isoform X3 [Apteryx rowi]